MGGYFDGSNYGKIEGLFRGDSSGSTSVKVLRFHEGIKLRLSYGKFVGIQIANVYGITLGVDV